MDGITGLCSESTYYSSVSVFTSFIKLTDIEIFYLALLFKFSEYLHCHDFKLSNCLLVLFLITLQDAWHYF